MKRPTLLFSFSITGILLLCLSVFNANAQLNINTGMTPAQLVQNVLVGGGVTISNVTYSGTATGIAEFSNGNTTNIGLDHGVVLCSGYATSIPGLASTQMGDQPGTSGDVDLDNIISSTTYNASVLEFDFLPLADTIRFRYVFSSDEYNDYVNSSFNDVFAFMLTGPNPLGPPYNKTNIALIPSTALPVAINNVNNGYSAYPSCASGPCTNCAYYYDNCAGTTIVFDGFTTVLTAWAVVTPCVQYHIKIAVADVMDQWLDSGVFLEANSFGTNGVSNSTSYTSNIDTMSVEGCNNAIVSFFLNTPPTDTTVISYTIAGTATNGIDYPWIPDSVVFLPGADSTAVWISPFNDGSTEPVETVYLIYINSTCGGTQDTITVYIRDYIPISSTTQTYSSCSGQSVTLNLNVTGGFAPLSYNWSPGGGTTPTISVNPTSNTTYILNVTDACGGSRTDSAIVNVSFLAASIISSDSVSCFGLSDGSATVQPSGGITPFSYNWSPSGGNAATATGLSAGTYTVVVTDSIGCTSTPVSVTIYQPALLTATISNIDSVRCFGTNTGSVTVTPSGGTPSYSFLWNTTPAQTSTTATNLAGGTYIVTITDHNGCTASATATVYSPTALQASIPTNLPAHCFGGSDGSLTASASGGTPGYSYAWCNGNTTITATGLPAGSCTVTVTDANGCTATQSAVVTQPTQVNAALVDIDSVNCYGQCNGTAQVTSSGGTPNYTYLWNNGQTGPVASGLCAGFYTVTVSDANTCTNSLMVNVPQPTQLVTTLANHFDSLLCFADSNGYATINVQGGSFPWTFLWNTNPPQTSMTANNLPAGNYTITITDANGCTATHGVSIYQPSKLSVQVDSLNVECSYSCDGQATSAVTGGTLPWTYAWYDTDGQLPSTNLTLTNLCPGYYLLIITDDNGCIAFDTTIVDVDITVNASFTATPTSGNIPLPVTFTYTGSSSPTNVYYWDFGDGYVSSAENPTHTYTEADTFTVMLIVSDGICSDTSYYLVYPEIPSLLIVPNVFTPNGDGVNDQFWFTYESISTFHCVIYNRWGKLMYEWDDISHGWDGKITSGSEASDGVYFYILDAKGYDDVPYQMHGTVTLIR